MPSCSESSIANGEPVSPSVMMCQRFAIVSLPIGMLVDGLILPEVPGCCVVSLNLLPVPISTPLPDPGSLSGLPPKAGKYAVEFRREIRGSSWHYLAYLVLHPRPIHSAAGSGP